MQAVKTVTKVILTTKEYNILDQALDIIAKMSNDCDIAEWVRDNCRSSAYDMCKDLAVLMDRVDVEDEARD